MRGTPTGPMGRQITSSEQMETLPRTGTTASQCHGTWARTGGSTEVAAVSPCLSKLGVHIGSVKVNLGHAEGAVRLVSVIKAVPSLENCIISLTPHIPLVQRWDNRQTQALRE
ncbi:hypothetical protein BO83DRAFT_426907 [Aspergillus eucalypticola CBS 122712]|uniref:Beta-ketoacyl synthase C-terminal domain-containing protein n=1 Tax=Aspergillus eucalypticola (strain CBS 122712 / IBT 29274) TaxID=1448314 RepID=A0A317VIP1_ASPEC|nr:uncharacterized protein BO83DRAFT_426907 [Aspergillus eucalypticola CBS 122712]PWY74264.1 hypothetical protein BO83DRAFT_426907 [Aspergillus eucalypticola CBS 122712]